MEQILFNISVTRFQHMPRKDVKISIGANKILLNEFHFFHLGNLKCNLFLNLSDYAEQLELDKLEIF